MRKLIRWKTFRQTKSKRQMRISVTHEVNTAQIQNSHTTCVLQIQKDAANSQVYVLVREIERESESSRGKCSAIDNGRSCLNYNPDNCREPPLLLLVCVLFAQDRSNRSWNIRKHEKWQYMDKRDTACACVRVRPCIYVCVNSNNKLAR